MSWIDLAKHEPVAEAREMARDVVAVLRTRSKAEHAIVDGAVSLGLSDRKLRSLVRDEYVAVSSEELSSLRVKYAAFLLSQSMVVQGESDRLRARHNAAVKNLSPKEMSECALFLVSAFGGVHAPHTALSANVCT
jgi:hypothetical protein